MLVLGTLAFVNVAAGQTVKAPEPIQKALTVLNRVTDHTGRLVAAKNFAQLSHENMEFKEGVEALEKSLGGEAADFKAKVEPLIKKVQDDSQHVADAGTAKDEAKVTANYAVMTESVKKLFAAFPANVQPLSPNRGQQKAEEKGGEGAK
jgi:hypothetical protein